MQKIHKSQICPPLSNNQPADFQKAQKQARLKSNRFYKGEQVSWVVGLAHFKMYGHGIYLFFNLLKELTQLFLLLTLVSIVPIVVNIVCGAAFENKQSSLSVYVAKTSMGNHNYLLLTGQNAYTKSIAYKIVNASFDLISCVLFLIFCLYWQKKSRNIEKHISKQIKLQSSLTLEVVKFPSNSNCQSIKRLMKQFGSVEEVVAAQSYSKQIKMCQQIDQLQLEIKHIQFLIKQAEGEEYEEKDEKQKKVNSFVMKNENLSSQLSSCYEKLNSFTQWIPSKNQVYKFYVQFSTQQERNNALKIFQQFQGIFSCLKQRPENLCIEGGKVEVKHCVTEPSGIIWQNAHLTWKKRILRGLLQILIILIIIVGGFIFVSFLNILVPPIFTDYNTSDLTFQSMLSLNSDKVTQAWCVKNYEFIGSSSSYFSTCSTYWKRYTNSALISILISLVVLLLCSIIRKIVYRLAEFQRYGTQAQKSVTIMTNLFVMDFMTTTLITFLMQANIFRLSVMDFLQNIIVNQDLSQNINSFEQFSDLTSSWYSKIGYQIWFNIFIMCFVPHLYYPLYYYLWQFYCSWMAKRQKVHRRMMQYLTPFECEIQNQYANFLLIVATGFIFGGGIQLMMLIVLICLFCRYYYFKFIFIRFCRVPPLFCNILNERALSILKGILISRCLLSLYMYGASDIFVMERSAFMKWADSLDVAFFQSIFIILSRAILTWYYTLVFLVMILVLIFKQFIFIGVFKLKKMIKYARQSENKKQANKNLNETIDNIKNNKTILSTTQLPNLSEINLNKQISQNSFESWLSNQEQEVRSQRNIIKSYDIFSNPEYAHILSLMNKKIFYNNPDEQIVSLKEAKELKVIPLQSDYQSKSLSTPKQQTSIMPVSKLQIKRVTEEAQVQTEQQF